MAEVIKVTVLEIWIYLKLLSLATWEEATMGKAHQEVDSLEEALLEEALEVVALAAASVAEVLEVEEPLVAGKKKLTFSCELSL